MQVVHWCHYRYFNLSGGFSGTATLATDLAINGTNQIVYQDSNNDSDVLPTGTAGQILASSGAGANHNG